MWSGVGLVLVSFVGWWFYNQQLDTPALVGIALIAAGVVVLNTLSKSIAH